MTRSGGGTPSGANPLPLPIAKHDGVFVASSPPGSDEARRGRDTQYDEKAKDPRDPDERRPQRRGPDDDGGAHALRVGDDGKDDDGDAGDGGPARGGGCVANLRPGPGARGGHGASRSPGLQGDYGS